MLYPRIPLSGYPAVDNPRELEKEPSGAPAVEVLAKMALNSECKITKLRFIGLCMVVSRLA